MGSLPTHKDRYHKSEQETGRFEDLEKLGISHVVVGYVEWCAPPVKNKLVILQPSKHKIAWQQQSCCNLKELSTGDQMKTCTRIQNHIVHNRLKIETTKSLLTDEWISKYHIYTMEYYSVIKQ